MGRRADGGSRRSAADGARVRVLHPRADLKRLRDM